MREWRFIYLGLDEKIKVCISRIGWEDEGLISDEEVKACLFRIGWGGEGLDSNSSHEGFWREENNREEERIYVVHNIQVQFYKIGCTLSLLHWLRIGSLLHWYIGKDNDKLPLVPRGISSISRNLIERERRIEDPVYGHLLWRLWRNIRWTRVQSVFNYILYVLTEQPKPVRWILTWK